MATNESGIQRKPYFAVRGGFLGIVNVDGSFRKLRRSRKPELQQPSPEYIEKHIWQRWHELLKRLKG